MSKIKSRKLPRPTASKVTFAVFAILINLIIILGASCTGGVNENTPPNSNTNASPSQTPTKPVAWKNNEWLKNNAENFIQSCINNQTPNDKCDKLKGEFNLLNDGSKPTNEEIGSFIKEQLDCTTFPDARPPRNSEGIRSNCNLIKDFLNVAQTGETDSKLPDRTQIKIDELSQKVSELDRNIKSLPKEISGSETLLQGKIEALEKEIKANRSFTRSEIIFPVISSLLSLLILVFFLWFIFFRLVTTVKDAVSSEFVQKGTKPPPVNPPYKGSHNREMDLSQGKTAESSFEETPNGKQPEPGKPGESNASNILGSQTQNPQEDTDLRKVSSYLETFQDGKPLYYSTAGGSALTDKMGANDQPVFVLVEQQGMKFVIPMGEDIYSQEEFNKYADFYMSEHGTYNGTVYILEPAKVELDMTRDEYRLKDAKGRVVIK